LDLMASSCVSINMSLCREEDFGLSTLESLQQGVPVICSDWAGLRDIVRHGEVGYRARTWLEGQTPKVDNEAAANYLTRLLEDEPLRKRFSSSGAQLASNEFSRDAFVRRISEIIESTLQAFSSRIPCARPTLYQPVRWVESVYLKAIRTGTVSRIYENPLLFQRLYSYYASPDRLGPAG